MICRSIEAPTPLVLPEGLQCSLPSRTENYEQESFFVFLFGKVLKSDLGRLQRKYLNSNGICHPFLPLFFF